MTDEKVSDIIDALNELNDDTSVPKNIKTKINLVINILNGKGELNVRVNKALDELDEVSDDSNLQPYTRTQLWNIASMLETVD